MWGWAVSEFCSQCMQEIWLYCGLQLELRAVFLSLSYSNTWKQIHTATTCCMMLKTGIDSSSMYNLWQPYLCGNHIFKGTGIWTPWPGVQPRNLKCSWLMYSILILTKGYLPICISPGGTACRGGHSVTSCRSQRAPNDGRGIFRPGERWKPGLTRAGLAETTGWATGSSLFPNALPSFRPLQ